MAKVLVVDDNPDLLNESVRVLASGGHEVKAHASAHDALLALAKTDVDVVLSDTATKTMSGLDLCAHVVGNRPDVPVILTSGDARLQTAIAAIRAGAYDFLPKPIFPAALYVAIERAVRHRALTQKISLLRPTERTGGFDDILGQSRAMLGVLEIVERVADTEASVLIGGASGTGKELVARALHDRSRRRAGPFVSVNCAALPETLLESELFGHARGAFTDAKQAHDGLFARARGGTLLLDEIGDMPLVLQPKLLRALQERRIRPVGSSSEIPIDVRFLASTNQDLELAVEQKRFRSDLLFRIDVVHIELPPLRARGDDVLLLARHFLRVFALRESKAMRGIGAAAAERLLDYDWPGNVRELQNCMERAVALGRFDEVGVDDLPERIHDRSPSAAMRAAAELHELQSLREIERRHIAHVLERVDGNKTTAANVLGIDRKTLYRKLCELD